MQSVICGVRPNYMVQRALGIQAVGLKLDIERAETYYIRGVYGLKYCFPPRVISGSGIPKEVAKL